MMLEAEDGFADGGSGTGREMIATCATCPAFSMCDNRNKLRPPSVENMTLVINYGLQHDLETDRQVEIHPHQKSKRREAVTTIDVFGFNTPLTMDNGNPLMLPQYGSKHDNIFMQLQDFPTPVGSPSNIENSVMSRLLPVSIPSLLPSPDDLPVDEYLGYFSHRLDAFLGFGHVSSSAYNRLYLLSSTSPPLRHVVLAFLTYLNDEDRILKDAVCATHLRTAIPQIQSAITNLNINEAHILAIPLLAYLSFWRREYDTASSHLRGFYKILLHMQYIRQNKHGKAHVMGNMPSIVLLMWRIAVRLDHYFTFLRPEEECLPPIGLAKGTSERFVTDFIDFSGTEWLECLVLEDELEDLRHLTTHYNCRASQLQESGSYEAVDTQRYINKASDRIVRKLNTHLENILDAAVKFHTLNLQSQSMSTHLPLAIELFPGKPSLIPFHSLHPRFLEAIIINRATVIQATISSHPKAGANSSQAVQAAEEVCWAFRALKQLLPVAMQGRGRILEALLYSGYIFCSIDHFFGTFYSLVVNL